jgi:hypothetical protein
MRAVAAGRVHSIAETCEKDLAVAKRDLLPARRK